MANFVRNHVRLREFSGRAKAVLEFLKEAKIEVNFLVFRTVEWTDGCLRLSASRGIFVPIKWDEAKTAANKAERDVRWILAGGVFRRYFTRAPVLAFVVLQAQTCCLTRQARLFYQLLVLCKMIAAQSPQTINRFAIGSDGIRELVCNPVTLTTRHTALPKRARLKLGSWQNNGLLNAAVVSARPSC